MPCHRAVHYVRGNGQAGLQGARPPVDRNRRLLLRRAEEARKDKERLAQIEAERERKLRESTYDEELRMREEEKEEKRNSVEKINFFQRVVPLQSMIKRAIKHGDAIMWGRP